MRAMIVDLRDGEAVALDEKGRIVCLPDRGYTMGQYIELSRRRRSHLLRVGRMIAVAAILSLFVVTGAAYALPYGTVRLNNGIEYTINRFDYVLSVQASNEEGEALLSELRSGELCHRPVEQALSATVEQMEQDGNLKEDDVLFVTAGTPNKKHSQRLQSDLEQTIADHHSTVPSEPKENRQSPKTPETTSPSEEKPESKEENPQSAAKEDSEQKSREEGKTSKKKAEDTDTQSTNPKPSEDAKGETKSEEKPKAEEQQSTSTQQQEKQPAQKQEQPREEKEQPAQKQEQPRKEQNQAEEPQEARDTPDKERKAPLESQGGERERNDAQKPKEENRPKTQEAPPSHSDDGPEAEHPDGE